jgi:hypothetical protein
VVLKDVCTRFEKPYGSMSALVNATKSMIFLHKPSFSSPKWRINRLRQNVEVLTMTNSLIVTGSVKSPVQQKNKNKTDRQYWHGNEKENQPDGRPIRQQKQLNQRNNRNYLHMDKLFAQRGKVTGHGKSTGLIFGQWENSWTMGKSWGQPE